jgi:hypothetical protein
MEPTCSLFLPAFLTSASGAAFGLGRLPGVQVCWRRKNEKADAGSETMGRPKIRFSRGLFAFGIDE